MKTVEEFKKDATLAREILIKAMSEMCSKDFHEKLHIANNAMIVAKDLLSSDKPSASVEERPTSVEAVDVLLRWPGLRRMLQEAADKRITPGASTLTIVATRLALLEYIFDDLSEEIFKLAGNGLPIQGRRRLAKLLGLGLKAE
jgi:hypothetical protein